MGEQENQHAAEILESITEGVFTLNRQWQFTYLNHQACRILDREAASLLGCVLWEAYPQLEGTPFERAYRCAMYERERSTFTSYYDLQQRWYEVTAFPAPDGVSVIFKNVTEQKEMEAERERMIAESETQRRIFETALNSTPDFVYVFDLEHRALYANDALLRTWGVSDVRGKRWMDLGYEQWHADLHDRELDQVIRTRAPIRGEIPFTGTNGTRVYDYIFAPVLDPDGEVVAVAGTTRDITERQAAEESIRAQAEQLAEADRVKDEFLATLSHELRNPLAPLGNSIGILRLIGHGDERIARLNEMMDRQVRHLVRLVDDLLEVSRISRGTFSLHREPVELGQVVRNAIETSQPLIAREGHALHVDVPAEPVWLDGDPVRLSQVIGNVLNNAAKYTEANGRIEVTATVEGSHAVVSVRDTGIGIAADVLPRIFRMFGRGERDNARHQGGLGIGLALSRRLAEMHGGTLEARSAGVGRGSEFVLRIPIVHGAEPAAAPGHAPGSFARMRTLVVDDNIDAGDSMCQLLQLLGAEARVARDGADALEQFSRHAPSVVLLDIGMPGMNGYEVARRLRLQQGDRGLAIIALTGWGQEVDRARVREAGFDAHLVKPADIDELQALLERLQPQDA